MAQSLGEKLRQAREARDITISEVAEQTRISPLYIESIENDDYRTLPGGIFNKGFVKSFAKYVGVDEQEALQDYSQMIAEQQSVQTPEDSKTYRPEVLTDDRTSSSTIPTIIVAVVILGLMTWGILALVKYVQENPNTTVTPVSTSKTEDNTAVLSNTQTNTNNADKSNANVSREIPSTDKIHVEFKAIDVEVSVEATIDGKKASVNVKPDAPQIYDPQQSLKLRYYKGFAPKVQLTINGKQITPPSAPKFAGANGIEFEINKENIAQILQGGQIAFGSQNMNTDTNTNTSIR